MQGYQIALIVIGSLLLVAFLVFCAFGGFFYRVSFVRRKGDKHFAENENPEAKKNHNRIWFFSQKIEEYQMRSYDFKKLKGYMIRNEGSNKLAFLIHGYRGRYYSLTYQARMFYEAGYNVFTINHRASDTSSGHWFTMGPKETRDVIDWINLLLKENPNYQKWQLTINRNAHHWSRTAENIDDMIQEFFTIAGLVLAKKAVPGDSKTGLVDAETLRKVLEPRFLPVGAFNASLYDESIPEDAGTDLGESLLDVYKIRRSKWPAELADRVDREIALHVIDQNWMKQIDTMARLREGIHLRSYANTNPLQDYVNEGQSLFRECLENISVDAVLNYLNVQVRAPQPEPAPAPAPTPVDVESKPVEQPAPAAEEEKKE